MERRARSLLPLLAAALLVACAVPAEQDPFYDPPVWEDPDASLEDDASAEQDASSAAPDAALDGDAGALPDVARDSAAVAPDARPDASAPEASAPRCVGSASGQSSVWTCTGDDSARQRCVAGVVETQRCALGCTRHASGVDDVCATEPSLPACPDRPLLAWGLHPEASDRLRCAGVSAGRITQTIGNAAASAGTHAQDGVASGHPYSAATDLSVRGLDPAALRALLTRLANEGFAAWYRWPGHDGWPSYDAPHIHAIFVGARMKSALQSQVSDWLRGRNGLQSHTEYTFWSSTAAQRALVRALFARYN